MKRVDESDIAIINIRIKKIEKDILQHRAETEGVTLTEYMMRRCLPEKYDHVKQLEEEWKKQLENIQSK